MSLLLALIAALWFGGRVYARSLKRFVAYRRRLSPDRLFPGEQAELVLEIENASRLPIPWVVTQDRVPEGCLAEDAPHPAPRGWPRLPDRVTEAWRLGPQERRRRRVRLVAAARGVYPVGPGDAWWTDPLGWHEASLDLRGETTLVVYPRLFPLDGPERLRHRPLGARPRAGWMNPDPLQIVGVRPYHPGDPYRQIHWAASARTGSLQARLTVPAYDPVVALFVDVRTGPERWGTVDRARAEAALSVAATLAVRTLGDGRASMSLFCDGVRLRAGSGAAHLRRVLETLARARLRPSVPLPATLRQAVPDLADGTVLQAVAPWVGEEELAAFARLRRPVELFLVGGEPPATLPPRVNVRVVPGETVNAWFS